jgi:hypothetical protein
VAEETYRVRLRGRRTAEHNNAELSSAVLPHSEILVESRGAVRLLACALNASETVPAATPAD